MAIRKIPIWVWGVRLILMFVGVMLVHTVWPMPLEASWGWGGYLRAGLIGVIGVLLCTSFDRVRQAFA